MQPSVHIGGRLIGAGSRPYFIAEIGSNHNGDMVLCKKLVDAAVQAGADAVKFQSWSDSSLISTAEYGRNTHYADPKKHFGSLRAMVEKYQFTPQNHKEIAAYCADAGVAFSSSVFSLPEVDLLESLAVPFHKIASMDVNHIRLLEYVAQTRKPVVLSTGMAEMEEIGRAVDILRSGGASVILLHCIALYPPPDTLVRLANITALREKFGVPVGFSDHTKGEMAAIAAIALGACMIEKHFTLDNDMDGWDHAISADPAVFSSLVKGGVRTWEMVGDGERIVSEQEVTKRKQFRRCIVAARSMKEGEVLSGKDLDFKRPGTGIPPDQYPLLIGKKLARAVDADAELSWEDLQ